METKSREESRQYVLKMAEQHDVKFIKLWFTDILGMLKSFAITVEELEAALEDGMGFDGSSIEGFARIDESDMVAMPDPDTFRLLPWRIHPGHPLIDLIPFMLVTQICLSTRERRNACNSMEDRQITQNSGCTHSSCESRASQTFRKSVAAVWTEFGVAHCLRSALATYAGFGRGLRIGFLLMAVTDRSGPSRMPRR